MTRHKLLSVSAAHRPREGPTRARDITGVEPRRSWRPARTQQTGDVKRQSHAWGRRAVVDSAVFEAMRGGAAE